MEPIISPWLIWAIQSCDNIKYILTGCTVERSYTAGSGKSTIREISWWKDPSV